MRKYAFGLLLLLLLAPFSASAFKIGVITDVHAGKDFVRDNRKETRGNILYPKRYSKTLKSVLDGMKNQGVEAVVYTGDNTNKDTPAYAKSLMKIANSSGLESLWVRGNHDLKKTTKYYFAGIGSTHYFVDRGGWRLIILDSNNDTPNRAGGIDNAQVDWMKAAIAGAPGPVTVFMHHPIFMIDNRRPDEVYPGYSYLESALSETGKVKYVISGHVHVPVQFSKNYNGVQYFVNVPLALKGGMNNYQILDLPEPECD